MRRVRVIGKWIGVLLGGLALTGLVLFGVATWAYGSRAEARYRPAPHELEIPALDEESREEAARLYQARGCADCHGDDGAGAVLIDAPPLFVAGPNLTTSVTSMSGSALHGLIRRGVKPSEEPVFFMPSHEYVRMPDEELGLIVAHIRSLPTRDGGPPPSELRPLGRVLALFGVFDSPLLPAEVIDQDAPPSPLSDAELGEYLAAGCRGCHGQGLSGGPIPGAPEEETGIPRNLTPHETGLAGWSLEDLRTALRTGQTPNGPLNTQMMPVSATRHMSDREIEALYAYLQSVEPRPFGGR